MKKYSIIFGIVLMVAIAVPASAYTINTLFATPVDDSDGYTSPYAGVFVQNFDGSGFGNWQGNGAIVTGSSSGLYAAPYGQGAADHTKYLTVPLDYSGVNGPPVVQVTGFGTANYLGLWWGSMDNYNTFTFYLGGTMVLSFTGTDVITQGATSGDQVAYGSNHYVNFVGLPDFDKFEFSSSQFAFEVDNVAIGYNVPEPTTMLLLGLGILGLAGFRKKS